MSQSSYGAMLGSSSSPLPQSGGFNSLHQHERMVTCPRGWAGGHPVPQLSAWGPDADARQPFEGTSHPSLPELPASFRRGERRTPLRLWLLLRLHAVRRLQSHAPDQRHGQHDGYVRPRGAVVPSTTPLNPLPCRGLTGTSESGANLGCPRL